MKDYIICPICSGKVSTIFRSREELQAVLHRHMIIMHSRSSS
jgi:hypothetical protein